MADHLPSKYRFSHEYSLFLHDLLVQVIIEGEKKAIFHSDIPLETEERAKDFLGIAEGEVLEWVRANCDSKTLADVLTRIVLPALLSDFCHFVFESLSCSRRAKLTVAFSNLRKPLGDNLFYLEWLLVDPEDFSSVFMSGDIHKLEDRRINLAWRRQLIERVVASLRHRELYKTGVIDEMRYDKKSNIGFASFWDQAIHLITLNHHIKTGSRNFNFVFSDDSDRESQWDFLYSRLPILLHYTVEIVEGILARVSPEYLKSADLFTVRRRMGFLLWCEDRFGSSGLNGTSDGSDLLPCPRCSGIVNFDMKNATSAYNKGFVKCNKCRKKIYVD